jgi:hypothetical protein
MKTLLAIVLIAVIVSGLAIMNKACKSGPHGWCAPRSAVRSDIKLEARYAGG